MPRRAGNYAEEWWATSAARTVNGDTGTLEGYGPASSLRIQLDVTVASGTTPTPTLDVVIEDTLDGINWNAVAAFATKTTAGREVLNVQTPFAERLRARWAIGGGTPSFTFSIAAASQAPQV